MCTCVCVIVSPVYAVFPLLSFHSDCAIVQIEQRGGVRMSRELEQWLLEERREGFKEGFKEEYKKGLEEGENRVAALFKRMKADGRLQDFSDALKDKNAREKLYKEYGIE